MFCQTAKNSSSKTLGTVNHTFYGQFHSVLKGQLFWPHIQHIVYIVYTQNNFMMAVIRFTVQLIMKVPNA